MKQSPDKGPALNLEHHKGSVTISSSSAIITSNDYSIEQLLYASFCAQSFVLVTQGRGSLYP
jgi:hypothetical protein